MDNRRVAVWGLTYKPGTNTLRRSISVELCRWLAAEGAQVRAHDPAVDTLPADLAQVIDLSASPLEAVDHVEALVIATEWPEYRTVTAEAVVERMGDPVVLDANRFLVETLGSNPCIRYTAVGKVGQ